MLRHWVSVTLLLLPVMTFGWLISSVFIWKLVPTLQWIEALVLAACVTATDPVLASAVVGKGKFARRVPGHLRNLLSAESGCNDGMAFPFVYLALLCIQHSGHSGEIAFHFIVITVLYECVFGTVLGAIIGYAGRHAIKFAEKKNLIDRESFLVFYFVLALFCTGVGSIIGTDDLLVAFAAGAAFSWDGWFARKTEESHVSNVIDLLLNMAFFVYFGAIVPWDLFNEASLGLSPWKLVIIAILIILFRRIPIMLALKPVIPDIRTWREALFCGHFGPIGVGAIFISILARAELEHDEPTPLAVLPSRDHPHYYVVATIWPVTTFLIIASIIVHGSSIAVFTLGKRLNNLTITMTYTTNGEQSQTWLSRLPRIDSTRTSISLNKHEGLPQDDVLVSEKDTTIRPATSAKVKPAGGMKRRKKSKRHSENEPRVPPQNIPIDLNADRRAARERLELQQKLDLDIKEEEGISSTSSGAYSADLPKLTLKAVEQDNDRKGIQAYQEGSKLVIEDSDGEVIDTVDTNASNTQEPKPSSPRLPGKARADGKLALPEHHRSKKNVLEPLPSTYNTGHGRRVVAYRLDDDIIIENLEGEVIRRYRIANSKDDEDIEAVQGESSNHPGPRGRSQSIITAGLNRTLSLVGLKRLNEQHGNTDLEKQDSGSNHKDLVSVPTTSARPDEDHISDERMRQQLKKLFLKSESKGKESSLPPYGFQQGLSPGEPRTGVAAGISPSVSPTNAGGAPQYTKPDEVSPIRQVKPTVRPASPVPVPKVDQESEDESSEKGDNNTDDSDGADSSDEEETEIEKQRRFAALGIHPDDDEDDDAAYLAARAKAVQAAEQARRKPGGI